ncbi:F-type H+-transporting ATPase subunit delta [Hydrogenivirga caldilitoris]|uniref:ATP synthase subunit delta n=1 Tax=Hydrogenivirga caldilitoris TaxID=246264 RepID=A0A497XTK8_9AQUI|nr:ATP synthase F1 subunit delta [Hydrogenivirga caldilitoris]RLJ71510.1 F-type H+-transporting ATPase subunit delta [Hydrogenivirga caldilitoris]
MHKSKDIARKAVRLLVRRLPKEKKTLMATGEFISFLAQLYRKSKDARNYFISPFVPKEKKLTLLKEIMNRYEVPSEALEVFDYLLDINALSLLPEMKRLYDHEIEKLMRMSKGFLFLAREIEQKEIDNIVNAIQKTFGRELDIEVGYDSSLIGGFVFKTSGFVVDTSVKRQLEKLLIHGG